MRTALLLIALASLASCRAREKSVTSAKTDAEVDIETPVAVEMPARSADFAWPLRQICDTLRLPGPPVVITDPTAEIQVQVWRDKYNNLLGEAKAPPSIVRDTVRIRARARAESSLTMPEPERSRAPPWLTALLYILAGIGLMSIVARLLSLPRS